MDQPKRMPVGALLAIIALVAILFLLVLPAFLRVQEAVKRDSCPVNLKQFGLVFRMYAGENQGAFPRRAPYDTPVSYMPAAEDLYPDYWPDPNIMFCPSDQRQIDARGRAWMPTAEAMGTLLDQVRDDAVVEDDATCLHYCLSLARSYVYVGHVVWDWQAVRALEDARQGAVAQGLVEEITYDFTGTPCEGIGSVVRGAPGFWDIAALAPGEAPLSFSAGAFDQATLRGSTPGGEVRLLRLHTHVARQLADGDTAETKDGDIPVMWEAIGTSPDGDQTLRFNHNNPPGGNVLYLDGHCGYVRRDDRRFPYGPADLGTEYDMTFANLNHFLLGQG